MAAANSLTDLGCSPDELQEDRACSQRATHSFIKLKMLRVPIALASSGKRKRPPEEGGRGSAWGAGQWNVKSDALRPKLARPSTLCTLLRWANSSTWFAEVT